METLVSKITAQALAKMGASDMQTNVGNCEKHGRYQTMFIGGKWSGCVQCGFEADRAKEAAEREAWRGELKAREWQAKWGRAAIPERFKSRKLDNYQPTCMEGATALKTAQEYACNFDEALANGRCLIFSGDVGTGKTHLAVGIAQSVMEAGRQAVFSSVLAAVRSVKDTYSKGSEKTEAQAIRDLVEPDLLILDEVGVQFGSDAEKIILFQIINGRYEACKPTIVISNLAAPDLEAYLATRSFDRLREGGGKLVAFTWKSFRKVA